MPRQRRSAAPARSAPVRPTVAPQPRPAMAPQQNRQATTLAAPRQQSGPPATTGTQQGQTSQGPGLFGQMASTAAGVAVGSSIGHAIGGFFGGGGSSAAAPAETTNSTAATTSPQDGMYSSANSTNTWGGAGNCEMDAKQFTKCMDEQQGNMQICGWYLEQLKACQQAAKQY
ncbi:MAG: hypothetical protein M1823_002817 [Watsoniomyces obsoletus]|nr:MAG: hypothetical protein M1823_002817 [Watsoniomyces obsoletus]